MLRPDDGGGGGGGTNLQRGRVGGGSWLVALHRILGSTTWSRTPTASVNHQVNVASATKVSLQYRRENSHMK